MDERDLYRAILQAQDSGDPIAIATVIGAQGSLPRHVGSKMVVRADGSTVGTVGGGAMESRAINEARRALQDGISRTVSYTLSDLKDGDPGICGGTVDLFIEAVSSPPTLLVIGCGHVGKALAELGKWMGYRVAVSDDRAEFCNPTHIPGMNAYLNVPPTELPSHIRLTRSTYAAAVTRGLPVDVDLLPTLLNADVGYIGLIGSRRRWLLTVDALKERGVSNDQIARIHAPIGLELNAETPHEIAVSIMAEITMLRRGGDGAPMRYLPGSGAGAAAGSATNTAT